MRPAYEPGYLRNGGAFVPGPRRRQCKYCKDPGESYGPIYICPKAECQAKKRAVWKATKKRYDSARRSKKG